MPQAGKGRQFEGNCYICQQVGHMAKNCLNQYCQLCGEWGHGMKMCKNQPGIKVVSGTTSATVPEETVIVQALIDGKEFEAMFDTGAGVSVTDFMSLKRLSLQGKLIKKQQGTLKAFENSGTKIIGQVLFEICKGGSKVEQCFSVIEEAKGGITMKEKEEETISVNLVQVKSIGKMVEFD